jgi:hypothetical protein
MDARTTENNKQKAWRDYARTAGYCGIYKCHEPPPFGRAKCVAHLKQQAISSLASYHARTQPRFNAEKAKEVDGELVMGVCSTTMDDLIAELRDED